MEDDFFSFIIIIIFFLHQFVPAKYQVFRLCNSNFERS